LLNDLAIGRRMSSEQLFIVAVTKRPAISEGDYKPKTNADGVSRTGDSLGVRYKSINDNRGVNAHNSANTCSGEAAKGNHGVQIRIHRWVGVERSAPKLQLLIARAESELTNTSTVIVRIHQCGKCEKPFAGLGIVYATSGRNGRDFAVVPPNGRTVRAAALAGTGEQSTDCNFSCCCTCHSGRCLRVTHIVITFQATPVDPAPTLVKTSFFALVISCIRLR
jgi:hypothetical protein